MMAGTWTALFALLLSLTFPSGLGAQVDWDQVELQVQEVRGGVFLLGNAGGNIAVFLGEDGVLMVDAGYREMAGKVAAEVQRLAEEAGVPPTTQYLVNTHWHFDHTQGNADFAGMGATIIAHERGARLMAEDRVMAALDREIPATLPEGRPVITFNDRMNLAWNGDLLHFVHMPLAHSDGDDVVHFRDADVIHLGDLFFNGVYPYIDVDFGGNLAGMVRAIQEILDHTNETTLFIPGHGPLGNRSDLDAYHEMLRTVLERVRPMVEMGMTREEVVAEKPTRDLDEAWTRLGGAGESDFFIGQVYDGFVRASSGG